jgi:outer membrane protein OmpA-like peptidoglycan-associated protein
MKKFLAVAFAFCIFSSTIFAQDDNEIRRPAIGISFVFNDFATPDRIKASNVAGVLRDNQWAKFKEMKAGLALHYFQGLKKHIDFAGTLSGAFLSYPMPNKVFGDNLLLEGDASLNLKMMSEKYFLQPYITAGIGASWYRKYWGAFIPLGVGLKINLFDETSLFTTGQYRVPVTNETTVHHFFYNLGIASPITKKKEVKIIPPPPPPVVEAPKDTDGDGITDDKDKCPNLAGTVANQGCPEVSQEIVTKTAYAARNIFFETGKATLLKKSYPALSEVAKILSDNPQLKLAIDGHTDNVGNDAFNQDLSEKRAAAVKTYLVSKGVDESRLAATGYGETQPVADNKTTAGRQKNRRVEMKPSYY